MIRVSQYKKILTLILLPIIIHQRKYYTESRAIMVEPPHRSSLWRFNYSTTVNLRDDSLNCGGYDWQWGVHGGRCGVCGDVWNGTQDNDDNGLYDSGIIVRKYTDGHYINITFEVSSNYLGYVEFRLCPRNTTEHGLDQSCFDRYTLWIDESHGTRYYIGSRGGIYDLHIRLPGGLVCKKCVLQWKFKTGYRYDDTCNCLGCGKQEQYVNCADIEIAPSDGWPSEATLATTTTGRKDQRNIFTSLDSLTPTRVVDKIQTRPFSSTNFVHSLSFLNARSPHASDIHKGLDFRSVFKTLMGSSMTPVNRSSNVSKAQETIISPNIITNMSTDSQVMLVNDTLSSYVTPATTTRILPPTRTSQRSGQQSQPALTVDALRRRSFVSTETRQGTRVFFSPPKEKRPVITTTKSPPVRPPLQGGRFQVPSSPDVLNTHFPSVSNILNRFYMTPFIFPGSNIPPGCNVFSDEFRCKARGIYNQSPGISKWCEINCRASNCVSFMCECSCEEKTKNQTSKCHAIAEFHGVEGMDLWCVANCKVGYCPANTCSVEDCIKPIIPEV